MCCFQFDACPTLFEGRCITPKHLHNDLARAIELEQKKQFVQLAQTLCYDLARAEKATDGKKLKVFQFSLCTFLLLRIGGCGMVCWSFFVFCDGCPFLSWFFGQSLSFDWCALLGKWISSLISFRLFSRLLFFAPTPWKLSLGRYASVYSLC